MFLFKKLTSKLQKVTHLTKPLSDYKLKAYKIAQNKCEIFEQLIIPNRSLGRVRIL